MKLLLMIRLLPIMGACLFFFSCTTAPDDEDNSKIGANASFNKEAIKDTIEAANAIYVAAMLKGDSVAVSNIYSDDAKIMGSNAPAITGRDAILGMGGGFSKMGVKEFEVKVIDIWGDNELVVEEGTYHMKDDKGNSMDKGKYICIWKKEDGKWKLFRDIGNSDIPSTPVKK